MRPLFQTSMNVHVVPLTATRTLTVVTLKEGLIVLVNLDLLTMDKYVQVLTYYLEKTRAQYHWSYNCKKNYHLKMISWQSIDNGVGLLLYQLNEESVLLNHSL